MYETIRGYDFQSNEKTIYKQVIICFLEFYCVNKYSYMTITIKHFLLIHS